ncbi:MAG: hypothetical protein ACE14V_01565 [bacterium]
MPNGISPDFARETIRDILSVLLSVEEGNGRLEMVYLKKVEMQIAGLIPKSEFRNLQLNGGIKVLYNICPEMDSANILNAL